MEVVESIIMIEEEMPVRRKSIVKYCQDFNSEESNDFNEREKRRPRRKKQKITLELIKEVCTIKITIMKDTLQKNASY